MIINCIHQTKSESKIYNMFTVECRHNILLFVLLLYMFVYNSIVVFYYYFWQCFNSKTQVLFCIFFSSTIIFSSVKMSVSIFLSISISIYLSIYLSISIYIYLSTIYLSYIKSIQFIYLCNLYIYSCEIVDTCLPIYYQLTYLLIYFQYISINLSGCLSLL